MKLGIRDWDHERLRQAFIDLREVELAVDNYERDRALGAGVRAATVERFRRIAVVAQELILREPTVLIEVVIEALCVVKSLLAFFASTAVNMIDHQPLVLGDPAAWTRTSTAVLLDWRRARPRFSG